jgi:membrane associated rhomboid family serine protease
MLRLTPVVRNLILINVVIFILQAVSKDVLTQYLALYNIQTQAFKPYQLFTYMFCHADFLHIFFNMLMFSFFGPILEEFWGQKRFLIFYTACGIGAGVFSILMDYVMGRPSIMIGASGAVYGVMTAFGIIFPNMELRLLFFPFSFKAKYLVMVLGSLAIYNGLRPTAGDNVAHLAHLGGIVIAIILIQFWRGRGSSGY